MRYGARVFGTGIVVLLVGCFRSPNSTFYTLTSSPYLEVPALSSSGLSVAVTSVGFPQYLDDPRIVIRASGAVVERLEYDRWSEDLERGFMRVLVDDLARDLKSSNVFSAATYEIRPASAHVQVEVIQFDMGDDGKAVLRVRWALARSGEALVKAPFEVFERSAAADNGSLNARVAALSTLVAQFAEVVSARLSTL
jgi:uncharacterized lipoprotein YmbA